MLRSAFLLSSALLLSSMTIANAQAAPAKSDVLIGKDGWLFYDTEYNNPTPGPQVDEAIKGFAEINALLKKRGITLYIAMVPLKVRLYASKLPDNFKLSAETRRQYDDILGKLKAKSIKYVDLNAAYLNNSKLLDEAPLFWKTDTHWSTLGVLEGASAIANVIKTDPAVQALPPLESTLTVQATGTRISAAGDLYNKLPSAEKANYTSGFLVKNVQINKQTAGQDLLSDDAPGIVLSGTSYAARFEGLTAKALSYYLQKDVLDVSEPAKYYFLPMYEYLKSETFRDNPPKVIVWELPERQLTAVQGSYLKTNDPKYLEIIELLKK